MNLIHVEVQWQNFPVAFAGSSTELGEDPGKVLCGVFLGGEIRGWATGAGSAGPGAVPE